MRTIYWMLASIFATCFVTAEAMAARAVELPPGLTSVNVAMPVPAFQLPNTDGKIVRSTDFRGKVLVLRIWATW
ncbi:MAG TPA: hypothetical protein VM260_11065 [Pirellula sp.]|nr:hypothetical protein [Pirellula sp.]